MSTYKRIKAVQTTIKVIGFLIEQREPVEASDMARELDLPVGTLMCHLMTLEDHGFSRCVGEKWTIGVGIALLREAYRRRLIERRDELDGILNVMARQDAEMEKEEGASRC